MVIKNKKKGFTLAEALVSMLILSVFFLAATKIITLKQREKPVQASNGYFECYLNIGTMKSQDINGEAQDGCSFHVPTNVEYFYIYVFYDIPAPEGGPHSIDKVISFQESFSNRTEVTFSDYDDLINYCRSSIGEEEMEKNGMNPYALREQLAKTYNSNMSSRGISIIW